MCADMDGERHSGCAAVRDARQMKKRWEAMQTLRAGCSKADPQTNKQTHRQGRLQYTAQVSAHCKYRLCIVVNLCMCVA